MRGRRDHAYNLAWMSSKAAAVPSLRSRKKLALGGFTLLLLAAATPAGAHGAIRDSSPAAGTLVTKPPEEVVLILAEPAAAGSTLTVTDGCGRQVSGSPRIQREIYSAAINGGQPGTWNVRMRSISAVDGHAVKGSFSFKVSGRKDCSPGSDATDDDVATSSRPPIENPDSGDSGFPVVPFALGTVVLVGLALAIRRPWARS